MRVFLSIKYHPDLRNRTLVESICTALERNGLETCCIIRDVELWGARQFSAQELMDITFREINRSDLLLVELSEKGVGLGIEAGYAHARCIPVVIAAPRGADISTTLQGIAQQVLRYENIQELEAALPALVHPPGKERQDAAIFPARMSLAGDYFPAVSGWLEELVSRLPAGSPVLELGCGSGVPVAQRLALYGFEVTGVDPSPGHIERARDNVPEGHFVCGEMQSTTFPPQSFSAVVAFYAMFRLSQEQQLKLFPKIYAWLRPGGYLLATAGMQSWEEPESAWLGIRTRTYWSRSSRKGYLRWLESAGFKIQWVRAIPDSGAGETLLLAQRP
ncbi:MAG: methyltransferase domain-containing protein [Chloroflexi bacterium]|nr:methyltransferase domain-containing protein [Chloroflexota bacterium]